MTAKLKVSRLGVAAEIIDKDHVQEVNKACCGIWVVLHLYKQGYDVIRFTALHYRKRTF